MLVGENFVASFGAAGVNFYAGVPCSILGAPLGEIINNEPYVAASSEGEALAVAAGAWCAGKLPAVISQNSGLGNMINPLSSLSLPFKIPTLLIIGWRGMAGSGDEPQHMIMGGATTAMLEALDIPWWELPREAAAADVIITHAVTAMRRSQRPAAILVPPGAFEPSLTSYADTTPLTPAPEVPQHDHADRPLASRYDALEATLDALPDTAAVIATTGKSGRELFTIKDRPQQLYMVGAMGSASAVGLGAALNTDRPIVVLDGDGAALMRLGTFATIGQQAPCNLVHVILDNGAHDSTGGQLTGSSRVDFAAVASACGYRTALSTDGLKGFAGALDRALSGAGPHLIHLRIAPGSKPNLARPTVAPVQVANRFRDFVTGWSQP